MKRRTRVLLVLCLLAVAGVWLLMPRSGRQTVAPGDAGVAATSRAGGGAATTVSTTNAAVTTAVKLATLNTNKLAFRVANTTNSIRQLETAPHAILLANAFIDTEKPVDLKIPAHLRAVGDPGAYIVQARHATDAPFRAALTAVGAQIVSYIPNNAYLVRVGAGGAGALQGSPLVQAVLPYEPYYKMQSSLLGLATMQQPLPPGVALNLGIFAADAATAEAQVETLGAKIIGRDRSAFGPVLRVLAPENWTPLAQSPVVQFLEPAHARVLANDLSRVAAGISDDTLTAVNYGPNGIALNGSNVLVAVDDTGIDATHPDLKPRVLGLNPIDLVDTNGHGTHVAGIIASSGAHSITPVNVGVFAEGSVSNADFRGKAPLATLFSIGRNNSDYTLQTTAALTNALISNNSWDYGVAEYDLAAASYDAATRDALPFTTGSQPVLFVFPAGNSGGGNNDGAQGSGDTILSPGTAKNVITVGALEQFRDITNIVTDAHGNKTAYWKSATSSGTEVAWYSSRGNVGIGTEGGFGRFKPDLVSPGTFVVSTRSAQWDTNSYYNPTNSRVTTYPFQVVDTNGLVYYNVDVPPNAIAVNITIYPNRLSPNPFPPDLLIYAKQSSFPTTTVYDILTAKDGLFIPPDSGGSMTGIQALQGNGFAFAVASTNSFKVNYDVSVQILLTNDLGDLMQVLEGMNELLAPYYRYESGTSMAAADVSGVLALIQDYFTNQFSPPLTPSPALLKALLINGCRTDGSYGIAVTNGINFQGWGLDNIKNCVPAGGLFNQADTTTAGSSFFVEQSPTNALATGDSHTFTVKIDPNNFGQYLQLQATLVWTDPPGDPAAAIKLVNNLDLIITNLDDPTQVFYGNDISPDVGFNLPSVSTNLNLDVVNNVENILLPPLLAGSYSVTVLGRSVNVNAVTAQTNNAAGLYAPNIVQDYALVVSIGEGEVTNAFTVADFGVTARPTSYQDLTPVITTNAPLYNQYAGASSPLLGTNNLPLGTNTVWGPNGVMTIGMTNQWHFYLVTNNGEVVNGIVTNAPNAAFITFNSANLSIPRMGVYEDTVANATRPEADIDLFVTQDPSITNLNPVAISNCLAGIGNSRASLSQGGTEYAFYTNSVSGVAGTPSVYYIGVKSEDQMGSEYAFLPVFSATPFSSLDSHGNQIVNGLLLPVNIPDGDPTHPGEAVAFALAVMPMDVEKVTVTNLNEHQNFGDLFGALSHAGKHVVLNNHDGFHNTFNPPTSFKPIIYDDSLNRPFGATNSDGPGSLVDYRRKTALGPWILGEQDNSLTMTGRVSQFSLLIQPHRDLTGDGIIVCVPPGTWFVDYVDVGAGYTNLTFYGTNITVPVGTPPIQMYERFGNDPTFGSYDQEADLTNGVPPGNDISVGPPLAQGLYFVGLYNPGATEQCIFLRAVLGVNAGVDNRFSYLTNSTPLLDDAVTGSVIQVPVTTTQLVASVNVGLIVNSPRISDFTFTLVNPTGERVLLMENRGGATTNIGHLSYITNFFGSSSAGGALADTNVIGPVPKSGILLIDYDFFGVPDNMDVYYDGTNIFHSGYISFSGQFTIPYGPGFSTNIVIVMNQGNNPQTTAWDYTPTVVTEDYNYLTFTDDTNLTRVPIKYAIPPFDVTDQGTNYTFSDFELATNGDYLGLTNIYDAFGGWAVPTNQVVISTIVTNGQFVLVTNVLLLTNNLVSVVTDPRTAQGGSNYLALGRGTISRVLPFTVGRKYQVSYGYRGPGIAGWWRGEGDGSDSSDPENNGNNGALVGRFNFPAGVVGQALQFSDPGDVYQFAATNNYVQVPASATLNVGTNGGFTIEGWINPTNLARPQPLVEWLAQVPTNTAVTNVLIVQGPVLNPATGHFYYLLATTNWTTSEGWATNLGGHLATIETANEANWIYDTFTAYGTLNRGLWIGLTFTNSTGRFLWSSGYTNLPYTNWMPGLPAGALASDNFVAILGPTNTYPGTWRLFGNDRRINRVPPTNQLFGVVEVPNIPTNGVQLWISGTNGTPGITNILQGCLYANIVDTKYVSHEIFSAPGLLASNIYQHVALTYNTNTGVAALYLNGTNVATTNLGVFLPKTDGDLLLGFDMTRYTNNFFTGKMDEMSIYSRPLSFAEISSIYQISVPSTNGVGNTNGLIGKFDPTIFPPLSLAKLRASLGTTTNILYAENSRWQLNGFTFTAATNSLPLQFTGLEPGVLLDSLSIGETALGNLYYLPEQALSALTGSSAAGAWTLQVWDNRAGAYLTNVSQVVRWQLSLVLESNAVVSATLPPQTPVTTTVPSGQIVWYSVTVPEWAHFATNILVSSTQPVDLYFNQTNPPDGSGPNDYTLLAAATSGSGVPVLVTNVAPSPTELPLLTNQTYYLGVRNLGTHSATVALEVDYDIVALTNGVPFTGVLNTNDYNTVRYFQFDVSSNAYEATFQLLKLGSNADLVLRKGVPLPTLTSSDYATFNATNLDESIYVLTNTAPVPLSAGRWYLGVFKRTSGFVGYSVLAKELDLAAGVPTVINLTNNVPFNWTAGPGAALTNFFHFAVTNMVVNGVTNLGLRFELYNLSGNGDLTVQTNAFPFAPPFYQASLSSGRTPERIFIVTNSALTNLLADWYLGVPNREVTNISYTIIAVLQTNQYFPAFPDAQGAGRGTLGGRSGDVYHVTTVSDYVPGSLRAAVNSGNRTVVFDVGGTITLTSPLVIANSYLTIAGQTAPGGITVAGDVTMVQSAHDVIIRDVRFRPGSGGTSIPYIWFSSFEGSGTPSIPGLGSYFAEGWHVDFGSVKWLGISTAAPYNGSHFIDMNGTSAGGISTNLTTVPGASYTLSFAYSQNPGGPLSGSPTAVAAMSQNGNPLLTLTLNDPNTSWSSIQWATTSIVFTATSPNTQIQIASQTPGAYGVLLDAIGLSTNQAVIATASDSLQFLNVSNVMVDHVSASWSANNIVSVLNSSNITVQWSIMANGLNQTNDCSCTTNHVIGSLLRYGNGTLSFHHNLYANDYSGSPRLGDNLTLDFVNNVVYNWGLRSGLTGGTDDLLDFSPNGCTNQLNYVCNYLIAGPDTAIDAKGNYNITNIAFFGGVTNAQAANWFFQTNNFIDSDTNRVLNGAPTGWNMFTNQYTRFGRSFPVPPVPVDEAFIAYERVLDFAGVALAQRDAADTNIVGSVRAQTATPLSLPPLSGLVAWWKGESNALDSVGANNGTLIGGLGFAPGEVGQAFNFKDTNGYVFAPASSQLNVGASCGFSVEAWINTTNISTQMPLVGWGTNAGPNTNVLAGPILNPATGHYYYLLKTNTWNGSEAWAKALGGHLVTINDANENTWVYNTFSSFGGVNRDIWIGLYDPANDTTKTIASHATNFVWLDGSSSNYRNWRPGEPNNGGGNPSFEYYTYMFGPGVGYPVMQWNDFNGSPFDTGANFIYGVVEVAGTPGVHLWTSVNWSGGGGPGCLYANLVDATNGSHIISSAPGLLSGNIYQHVALTYDASSGLATLYLNGISVTSSNLGVFVPKTTGDVVLGKRVGGLITDNYSGRLDEVSIYKRALSSNEVAAIYSAGSAGKNVGLSSLPTFLDTDQDGIPDFWEDTFPNNSVTQPGKFTPSNNGDRDGDGYSDLEEYNNFLAVPHAFTITNTPVGVDLYQLCGESGHLAFSVTNSIHGKVYLTNVLGAFTNTVYFSNSFAIFTPTNSTSGGTNYYGYASFDLYVTNLDTSAYFGPVPVSVMVSAVPLTTNPPPDIITLTNGLTYDPTNYGGSQFYHIVIKTNEFAAVFQLDDRTGPMALLLRYGLPLPSLSSYDYSTNVPVPPASEQIAVLTNSTPVPLQAGDWYLAAVNLNPAGAVYYTVKYTALGNILPPLFLFPTNTTVTNILETVPVAITCVATDVDTPALPLSYVLLSGPSGMSLSNNVLLWTPTEAQGPSTNTVVVSISNGAFAVTNSFLVNVLESNLPPVLPSIPNQLIIWPGTLLVTNAATDLDIPTNALVYSLFTAPTNAVIDTNGVITWTPLLAQNGSNYLFTTVVTDTNSWAVNAQSLSATNSFSVTVLPLLPPGQPLTNIVGTNGINWFAVVVPTNAIYATNTLIFSTLPVNLWFSTNLPPSITNAADTELLANQTNGISVLSTNLATAPTNLVPGGIYFLGVQNTNSIPVTNALRVDFALAVPPPVLPVIPIQIIAAGDTLVVTNTASDANTNAVLVYFLTNPPAGAGISANGIITWPTSTNLAPTNVVITTVVTDTSANLSATNSFTVIVLPGLVIDQPQTNIVGPHSINWFVVNVPPNADFATNILLFATGPLNLWFSTNVPPSVTNSTDFEMLANSLSGSYVMNTNAAPLLAPGSRYFLGVQNNNNFAVTNAVKVDFHLISTATNFVIFSIVHTNMSGSNGFLVTWFAPTNYQFHLQWTPALAPRNWTNFNGVISFTSYIAATNSQFQYFDDGSQTGGFDPTRFYRLLLLSSPSNTAPFFLNNPGTLNASVTNLFSFADTAKDWDIPPQALTYSLSSVLVGTNFAVINSSNGVITWTPDASQLGLTDTLTVTVTDNGVPPKTATNSIAILVGTNAVSTNSVPPFASVNVVTNGIKLQWTGLTNQQFQIRWATNLSPIVWHLFPNTNTSTTGNFSFVDTNTPLWLMKFYQLMLLP